MLQFRATTDFVLQNPSNLFHRSSAHLNVSRDELENTYPCVLSVADKKKFAVPLKRSTVYLDLAIHQAAQISIEQQILGQLWVIFFSLLE